MAEEEPDKQPSLELPKLGFRRKRRTPPAEQPPPPADAVPDLEETRPIVVEDVGPEPEPEPTAPGALQEPKPPKPPREKRERGPGGMPAAVLTGVVVGLGIVGLTWASLRSCEAVQGTTSCGDAGYPMLGLILVVLVVLGSLLLRFLKVADPTSTSFLGVGLAAVVALLVLVDHLLDREMVVVIPLVCAGTFAIAHWVTRTFIEPAQD